jgi:hypothetical protein
MNLEIKRLDYLEESYFEICKINNKVNVAELQWYYVIMYRMFYYGQESADLNMLSVKLTGEVKFTYFITRIKF